MEMHRRELLKLGTASALIAWMMPRAQAASLSLFLLQAYWVNPITGNDSNSGQGANQAWASMTPVAGVPANAVVFIQAGSVFQPISFAVPQAGVKLIPVGVGANPVFDASTPISTSWTAGNGSNFPTTVWQTPLASNPLMPVFPSGVQAIAKTSAATCTAAGNWFWDSSGHFLYVYNGASTPGTSIGIPTNAEAMTINGHQNVVLGSITVRGSTGAFSGGFHGGGLLLMGNFSGLQILPGFVAENCYQVGLAVFEGTATVTNVSVTGATFRNNGASGFGVNCSFFNNWYIGQSRFYGNCCVTTMVTTDLQFTAGFGCYSQNANDNGNSASNAGQGTIFELNWCYNNGIDATSAQLGIGAHFDTVNGWIIRKNNFYGNISHGLLIEKNGSSIAYFNNCWGNCFLFTTTTAQLALECSGGQNMTGCQIFNNTCYGAGGLSAAPYQGFGASTFSNNLCTNNISINAAHNLTVIAPGGDNTGGVGTGNTYTFNCMGAAASGFILYGASTCNTYAAFDTAVGSATSSVQGDPKFTNPSASPPDFSLQVGSPCVGASTAIMGYITTGTNLGSSYPASL